ncbi:hypothetical protein JJB07_04965 [Tumebacillus sp. ITR2]|uniref:Uracil-DNA glycosylase-like domain-containing protein n=1 Tax=Tumebacillus amylolyticus TaxID=2801339 RepID=A0ABS1J6U4_9BACL|nr:hypothetical protein [Tumebacillus amylolyticus]MBL0385997.1 hypothetical protein [Tumebacillus amylolyticus]
MMTYRLERFLPKIEALPAHGKLRQEDLLTPAFRLQQQGSVEIYYAPHNDYINTAAKVCIVGITPGWQQMELSFRQVRDDLQAQTFSLDEIARRAKEVAGLAGTMRKNVIEMLDDLGLPEKVGVPTAAHLFSDRRDLLHTTSLIHDPVFVKGRNYTGHTPQIASTPILKTYAYEKFPHEWKQLTHNPLLIPLGKSVADILATLIDEGVLDRERCLLGFPHPSGANGHRKTQFAQVKEQLQIQLETFFLRDCKV